MLHSAPARDQIDALGQSIAEGRDLASYLWQVPGDEAGRQRIVELLKAIEATSRAQGRREMPRICHELARAARVSPSPQQMEILQDGFDRLYALWQAARSGMV